MNWDITSKIRERFLRQTPRAKNAIRWAVGATFVGNSAFLALAAYYVVQEYRLVQGLGELMVVLFAGFLFFIPLVIYFQNRLSRLEQREGWLSDVARFHFERLKVHGLIPGGSDADEVAVNIARWPWGNHHTETLGHLEAAARKWWVLYDPSDLTTAPTNEMVIDWLLTERNLSREKARAIASMLRPDGLPTGPRR